MFSNILNILANLHFFVIQADGGLKLGEGSRGGVSIAIHVRTARATIQLLPAAVTIPFLISRRSPGKVSFFSDATTKQWLKQIFCVLFK